MQVTPATGFMLLRSHWLLVRKTPDKSPLGNGSLSGLPSCTIGSSLSGRSQEPTSQSPPGFLQDPQDPEARRSCLGTHSTHPPHATLPGPPFPLGREARIPTSLCCPPEPGARPPESQSHHHVPHQVGPGPQEQAHVGLAGRNGSLLPSDQGSSQGRIPFNCREGGCRGEGDVGRGGLGEAAAGQDRHRARPSPVP